MQTQTQLPEPAVACPKCRYTFPLSRALSGPIEAAIAQRLEAQYAARDRQRDEQVKQRLAAAATAAATKARADSAVELASMAEEVAAQRGTIQALQQTELALRRRTKELEAREQAFELEVERAVDARLKAAAEEATSRAIEAHRLKDLEKDKQLADLRRQLEDASRKAQQGSQQLQGEVAELDLEAQLRQAFPGDHIEPIAAGQRGADVLQRVVDPRGQPSGSILVEVRNRKTFSDEWMTKLREDQRGCGADLAVLVTTTLPKDVATFAHRGGVWITGFACWLPLVHALRAGLLEAARVRVISEGQAEKQVELMAYCGSVEFQQRIEAMLEPIVGLIEDLEKERRALEAAWGRREKRYRQLGRAVARLYGDVSGILGTLPCLPRLELPAGDDEREHAA